MGTGARESGRLLKMSPTTERRYREAPTAAGLFDGAADAPPEYLLPLRVGEAVPLNLFEGPVAIDRRGRWPS